MGTLSCLEIDKNVLYSEDEIVARVDRDGDLSVYCYDSKCAFRTNIPMEYIEELVEYWKKNKNKYHRYRYKCNRKV